MGDENRSTGPLPASPGSEVSVKVTAPPPFAVAVSVGSSFTGVIVTFLVAVLLLLVPSLTWIEIVRDVLGSWLLVAKVIERSTVCHCAVVAEPLSARISGAALVSVIPNCGVKLSTSPVCSPAVMLIVALAILSLSVSATVNAVSTKTGVPVARPAPSMKVLTAPGAVTTGASFTGATLTVLKMPMFSKILSFGGVFDPTSRSETSVTTRAPNVGLSSVLL